MDCPVPINLLSGHREADNVVPIVSSLPLALDSEPQDAIFSMVDSASTVSRAVSLLFRALNWTRVGLIVDSLSPYLKPSAVTTAFRKDNIAVTPYVDMTSGYNAQQTFDILTDFALRITYISVQDREFICDLLQDAFAKNRTWPQYAWIVYGHFSTDFREYSCGDEIIEGVVFVNQEYHSDNSITTSSSVRNDLLYDSVLALVNSSNGCGRPPSCLPSVTFLGRTGVISFTANNSVQRNISFSQVVDGTLTKLATYSPANDSLVQMEKKKPLPSSDLSLVFTRTIPLVYSTIDIVLISVFVTIILCLYLFYRKEKEVKATSVSLSLLMFLGCYLLIGFLATIAVEASLTYEPEHFNLCTLIVWLSGIALPIPLILATLLVKMLRIYKIFHTSSKMNTSFHKDYILAVYVLLLVSPSLVILTVFSTDAVEYKFRIQFIEFPSFIMVIRGCTGDIDLVTICLLVYFIVLVIAACVVAVMSRKLRIKLFSDTKSVNAFLFVLLLETVITFSLWFLFEQLSEDNLLSDITLYTGTTLIVLSCQLFLFVPKILPPLKRSLCSCKLRFKSNGTTIGTSETRVSL